MSMQTVKEALPLVQKSVISIWLTNHFFSNGEDLYEIARWDDFYFSISRFNANHVVRATGLSYAAVMHHLNALADSGEIQRIKENYRNSNNGPVRFLLSREQCDALAEEATRELESLGYAVGVRRTKAETAKFQEVGK